MTAAPIKFSYDTKAPKADALIFFAEEGAKLTAAGKDFDKKIKGGLSRAIAAEKFEGKKASTVVVPGPEGTTANYVIVVGLGKVSELTLLDAEKTGSSLTALLNSKKVAQAAVHFDVTLKGLNEKDFLTRMSSGAILNSYRFDKYLTKEPKEKKPTLKSITVVTDEAAAMRKSLSVIQKRADAVFLARDLISEVPNVLYPESFANIIKKELSPLGIEVKVLGMKEMEKMGMGAIVAVGKGSVREPKMVTMQYRGGSKTQKNIAFVGKGVTFDTGGISLKPGPGMEDMKWDMSGAAAVVGLMKTLAVRGAKVNAVGVVGLAENMPSGNAYRPGDIVTSMSGQTVEVHNTDAEGRLVLCDALTYCQQKFNPTEIVDLATLTGAVIIALGSEYAGIFSNDDAFSQNLISAGKQVGEHLWPLPLNDAWDKAIDTPQADMKNISGSRDAGSAIGAHFLKRFVNKDVKWAHLDIAGVAWTNKDRMSTPKGAVAFGVRLLDQYVTNVHEKN